jgi:hypothetical protein
MKTISFVDFWGGFNPYAYFIPHLFPEYTLVPAEAKPDVLVYSVFGNQNQVVSSKKRVHFSGENTDPRTDADLNLTFRLDNSDKRNVRLPLWVIYCSHTGNDYLVNDQNNPSTLCPISLLSEAYASTPIDPSKNPSTSLICSNVAAGSPREYLYNLLKPRSYGKAFNQGVRIADGELAKLSVIRAYAYNLCPENSIGEGYTTEKLMHAFAGEAIPIYWGWIPSNKSDHDFNLEKCIVYDDKSDQFIIGKDLLLGNSSPALNVDKYKREFTPAVLRNKVEQYV